MAKRKAPRKPKTKRAAKPRAPKKARKERVAKQPPLNITINSSGGSGAGGNSSGGHLGGSTFEAQTQAAYADRNNELFARIHDLQASIDKSRAAPPSVPQAPKDPPASVPTAPPVKSKPSLSTVKSTDYNQGPIPRYEMSSAKVSAGSVPSSFEPKPVVNLTTQKAARVYRPSTVPEGDFVPPPAPTSQAMIPHPAFIPAPVPTMTELSQALVPFQGPSSSRRVQPTSRRPENDRVQEHLSAGALIRQNVLQERRKQNTVKERVAQIEESVSLSKKALIAARRKKKRDEADINFRLREGLPVSGPAPVPGDKRKSSVI